MILALLAAAALAQGPVEGRCTCKTYLSMNFCADLSALGLQPDPRKAVEDPFLLVRELWKPGDTARHLDSAWSHEFRLRIMAGGGYCFSESAGRRALIKAYRRGKLIGVSDSVDVGVVDCCHGEAKTVKLKPKGRK